MEDFPLKWRFTNEKYYKLPKIHLNQLSPLNKEAARFLWDYVSKTNLHAEIPFKKDFFSTIDKARIINGNEKEIKKGCIKEGFLLANLFIFRGTWLLPWLFPENF